MRVFLLLICVSHRPGCLRVCVHRQLGATQEILADLGKSIGSNKICESTTLNLAKKLMIYKM